VWFYVILFSFLAIGIVGDLLTWYFLLLFFGPLQELIFIIALNRGKVSMENFKELY
jgi:hypothetical protein